MGNWVLIVYALVSQPSESGRPELTKIWTLLMQLLTAIAELLANERCVLTLTA